MALRVVSFELAVFSQSPRDGDNGLDSALSIAERRAAAAVSSSVFVELLALFMVCAHRDPTRLNACFENGHSLGDVMFVQAHHPLSRKFVT